MCTFGALLIALSNLVDHTDGELARISGQSSKIGHFYDLACDALATVLLFLGIAFYVAVHHPSMIVPAEWLGGIAGVAVALIFFLRMRIESMVGKSGTKQASMAGFETEDVLSVSAAGCKTILNGMTWHDAFPDCCCDRCAALRRVRVGGLSARAPADEASRAGGTCKRR